MTACPISGRAPLAVLLSVLSLGCGASAQQREQEAISRESTAEALLHKGDAAAAAGDMTRAEQYLVASLKAGGNERAIVGKLLIVCASDQRYPVALEYAERYLHRHPHDDDVKFAAASMYAAIGDVGRARSMLEAVVTSKPQWADPHYALATVLREEGPSEQADLHDLQYLKLDPNGPLAEAARARLRRTP